VTAGLNPRKRVAGLAQLAVADDQKVAAAAGRIKERQGPRLLVEFKQSIAIALDLRELGPEVIEKQGLDESRG
jgi:hypothetical protein